MSRNQTQKQTRDFSQEGIPVAERQDLLASLMNALIKSRVDCDIGSDLSVAIWQPISRLVSSQAHTNKNQSHCPLTTI